MDITPTNKTIEPGHYILRHDVRNPKCDRRTKDNIELAEVWKKGTRVQIVSDLHDNWNPETREFDGKQEYLKIVPYSTVDESLYGRNVITEFDRHGRFDTFCAALEPVADGLSLARDAGQKYVRFEEFLDEMIRRGTDVAFIQIMIDEIKRRDDEEYDRQEAEKAAANA